ncbi:MAG: hypothetical protein AAF414_13180, partial [Pseudomonadota bacterium]
MADDEGNVTEPGGRPGGVSAADFLAALERIQNRLDRIENRFDAQQNELRELLERPATPLNVETREPDLLADPETSSQPEAPEVAESVDPVDLPPQPTAP